MTTPDPQYVQLLQQTAAAAADGDPTDELVEQLHTRYLQLLRGGQTADGYPYPDPTDPLAEGADAIRALAEALASRTLTTILASKPVAATLPTGYPEGVSIMALSSTEAPAGGWPITSWAIVLTFRVPGGSGAIQYIARGMENTRILSRNGNVNGWGAWGSAAAPFGEAAGVVNVAASGITTVNFPAGTFTSPPVVTATPAGNSTVGVAHIGNITATSFEVRWYSFNGTQGAGKINWHAVQMTSASAVSIAPGFRDVDDPEEPAS